MTTVSGSSTCPKRMVFGPCGGVRTDGGCEVSPLPCIFAETRPRIYEPESPSGAIEGPAREFLRLLDRGDAVFMEMPSDTLQVAVQQTVSGILARSADAVLLGDAPWSRVQFPAVMRARWALEANVRPLPGITCRDRNRVALEGELAGLAALGVPAVLCLTGDHPALGNRSDALPVFDLDSVRLAALVAKTGMLAAVAESPGPAYPWRLERLEAKHAAGARVCIINHGTEAQTLAFAASAAARMPALKLVASVPMVVSLAGLERVAAFFPDSVPDELRRAVTQGDPWERGVERAARHAQKLLRSGLFAAVDLSAAAGVGEEVYVAEALAECGARIASSGRPAGVSR